MDRALFITAGPIGDALLTSGLLHRLVETQPQTRFTIAAGPAAAPLFAETPRLERLIPIAKQRYSLHWFDLWRQVGGRRWTTVIDMRGSGLAYTLWAKRRYVYRPSNRGPGAPILHKVEEAARTMGLDPRALAVSLYVPGDAAARGRASRRCAPDPRDLAGRQLAPENLARRAFRRNGAQALRARAAAGGRTRSLLTGARKDEQYLRADPVGARAVARDRRVRRSIC